MTSTCDRCEQRIPDVGDAVVVTAQGMPWTLCGWVCAAQFTVLRAAASSEPIPAGAR